MATKRSAGKKSKIQVALFVAMAPEQWEAMKSQALKKKVPTKQYVLSLTSKAKFGRIDVNVLEEKKGKPELILTLFGTI